MAFRTKHPRQQMPSSSSSSPPSYASRAVVLELLEEQCALVEDYANAQTALYNAVETANRGRSSSSSSSSITTTTASPNGGILRAVERLDEARTRVRSNFSRLSEVEQRERRLPQTLRRQNRQQQLPWLRHHLGLSERVVGTIASSGQWHANGLPAPVAVDVDVDATGDPESLRTRNNTVAIAALRASVARIRAMEGDPRQMGNRANPN